MSERDKANEKHIYLSEWTRNWSAWLEMGATVIFIVFALLCAVYSIDGFWGGLWNALKQI
jgi:hypothetical protein